MSPFAIIDTCIYIDHYRKDLYRKELAELQYVVRNSSVVIAELSRGCLTPSESEVIEDLAGLSPLITPTENNWLESGSLLSTLAQRKNTSPQKIRDLHFDVLIALSARSIGAIVITNNQKDFEDIQRLKYFKLMVWD